MNRKELDINLNISLDLSKPQKIKASATTHIDLPKVETSLTVAQLAYLCRIFHDLGYFTNGTQTEILKVMSTHFVTANASDISLNSLRAKYYSPDQNTKQNIKSRIIEILNHINHPK